jgi:hypothetical protein
MLGSAATARGEPGIGGAITGSVIDKSTGLPMLLVTVVVPLEVGEQSEFTDVDGLYTISGLPPGPAQVVFTYGGVTVRESTVVIAGASTVVNATIDTQIYGGDYGWEPSDPVIDASKAAWSGTAGFGGGSSFLELGGAIARSWREVSIPCGDFIEGLNLCDRYYTWTVGADVSLRRDALADPSPSGPAVRSAMRAPAASANPLGWRAAAFGVGHWEYLRVKAGLVASETGLAPLGAVATGTKGYSIEIALHDSPVMASSGDGRATLAFRAGMDLFALEHGDGRARAATAA